MNSTGVHCLIVDDEADFAEFVAEAMTELGYTSDICTVPTEIGTIYSTRHEIIILDLFMPGMDGIELLRFLHDNGSRVTLIFMSGKDKSVLHAARELAREWSFPVLGALQKPFTIDELDAVVGKYVPSELTRFKDQEQGFTVDDISDAMRDNQFHLVFQPQVSLKDSLTHGLEALIRWNHPVLGSVSPADFVPFAEQNGLIDEINLFVARKAIEQLGQWTRSGYDLTVSFNVSPASIADLGFPEFLADLSAANGVETTQVTVEVTETAVMSDVGKHMDMLTRLRMKGFGLAIDDFGTGYSSLHQLVRLPFNELKIDQAFVTRISEDAECETVATMATLLAHELGMTVVAEGLEDQAGMELIRKIGCDLVQGYFCAKPMLPSDLETWFGTSRYEPLRRAHNR